MSESYSTDLFKIAKIKHDSEKTLAWRKRKKAADPKAWLEKEKARRAANPRKASCHPDLPHQAKGLCKPCYMKQFLSVYERSEESRRKRREKSWQNRSIPMTVAEYDVLLESQGWGCAICKSAGNGSRRLSVDHDHKTGKVRGLLCDYCNRRLLIPRNSPEILRRAADYLEMS